MLPEGSLPHSQVPPTGPYPDQDRSVHTLTSQCLKIHLNIILPSAPGSPKWSLTLRFPQQNRVYAPLSSRRLRATCPDHLILLDFITKNYWAKCTDH